MIRSAPRLALAGVLICVSGWLYYLSNSVDAKLHLHISSQLRQLHQLDESLGQLVLKARIGMLKNYDPLVQTRQQIAELVNDLKTEHGEFFDDGTGALTQRFDDYVRANADKGELIEQFKSQNAVLRNSARYFPIAVQQLLEGPGHLRDGDPLEVEVRDHLLHDIMLYQVTPSDALLHAGQESRSRIAQRMAGYPPRQRKQLESLVVHTAILVAYKEEIDRTVDSLFAAPTAARLDEVFELYNSRFEHEEHRANLYRFWLLLLALGGLLYGVYALLRATRAQAELKRSVDELEFQKFALDQHSIVSIADRRGTIIYVNQRFSDVSQYAREELLGQDHRVLNSGYHPPEFFRQMWQTIARGQVWQGEVRNRRKDGSYYWVDSTIVPFLDQHGQASRYVSIRTDITARKVAEEVLQAAKEAAEAASRAKSDFLANMSHEIRTPMNGIIGMTELALDTELSAEQREYLGLVHTSAQALLAIINDILDFSKIEAGKMDIECIDFELHEMLAQTLAGVAPRARQKGLEPLLEVAPEVPLRARGDPGRLRQVLLNLLGNAIKFTEHGEVALRVAVQAGQGDRLTLRMSVSDTGIGIPADKLHSIFESFSQADTTTTRKYGGTGLGLTISARLAELMHGRIRVESTPGQGSTFHVEVCLQAASQPLALPDGGAFAALRVLVVDGYPASRDISVALLQRWRMRVTAVGTAAQADDELRAALRAGDAYCVLIADAQLPDGDGYALVEAARGLGVDQPLPLLLLASAGERGAVSQCSEADIPYLCKPLTQSGLFDALMNVLGGTRAAAPRPSALRDNRQELNILLAEDNSINQTLATRLLEKFGHRVTVADNGAIAVERWRAGGYDVILMDVDMPELNGYAATAQIRALERDSGAHIPIIGLTAHAMQGSRENCLAAGMDGYLSKPIDTQALWQELENLSVDTAPTTAAAPPATQDEGEFVLGFELHRALRLMDNDRDLFDEMSRIYCADYPAYVRSLGVALAERDSTRVRQQAHALRGMVAVFDVPALAQLAAALETQPGAEHSARYARLQAGLDQLAGVLAACVAEPHPDHTHLGRQE